MIPEMAADLNFSSVPPQYTELYNILCPREESSVDQDMFIKLLVKSSLPKQTLSQIWELVDSGNGHLTRGGVFKALVLTALAQQGKTVSEKLLHNLSGKDLPKPSLGDLGDLRALSIQVRREKNPSRLGLSYNEICSLDVVQVALVPEKKGLFLKHVEYEVTSQRYKAVVQRRYNDFIAFYEILLMRFPCRLIPQLPPKKIMGADTQFIEERRKALKRFVNLIARHPVVSEDRIVQFFLTFIGSDVGNKMKENFKQVADEFMTSSFSSCAKDLLPLDSSSQLQATREQMRQISICVLNLRNSATLINKRTEDNGLDTIVFGKEISSLSKIPGQSSDWGTGGNHTWEHLRQGLKLLSPLFAAISQGLVQQAQQEEEEVVEKLNEFIDLMAAYKDLCERYEISTTTDERAVNKLKKRYSSNPNTSMLPDAELEQSEQRNQFSLHCIHLETQLLHSYMEVLIHVLHSMVTLQVQWLNKLSNMWEQMCPLVDNLEPMPASKQSTPSPAALSR